MNETILLHFAKTQAMLEVLIKAHSVTLATVYNTTLKEAESIIVEDVNRRTAIIYVQLKKAT